MSKSAEFEALAEELRALQQAGGVSAEAVLVTRLLHGFTLDHWQEFRRRYPSEHWCALPVEGALLPEMGVDRRAARQHEKEAPGQAVGQTPERMADLLVTEIFVAQIHRELLRLTRTGGDLALLSVALCGCEALEREGGSLMTALDALLAACLRQCGEECDSLCSTAPGCYSLLLPGMSRLRARLMAEQAQRSFAAQAAAMAVPRQGEAAPACAVGIACFAQGERPDARGLLEKATLALQNALAQKQGHISLADGAALEERTTLVHSNEKRFLFFGGIQ